MNQKELTKRVIRCLGLLLRFDHYLLENNTSERSISHKLAEYLAYEFADFNVDTEFNKFLKDPKEINILANAAEENLKSDKNIQVDTEDSGAIYYFVGQKLLVTDKQE